MSESAIIQMVLDLEKLLNVESYVWVDPPEHKYDLKTPVSMNALCINGGKVQTISKYKADTYLLLNRSGKEIIDQFLDAVVNNSIFPKYVIISKKRSVWEKSLAEHSELRKKYLCFFLSNDKSICILLKKRYRNICSKNNFFIKYKLKQYFFEAEIITIKSIIGSIKKFLLRQHFSRELYGLWRENRNIKFFCKSLYRILAERCQNLNINQESADSVSNLELCIYDTEKIVPEYIKKYNLKGSDIVLPDIQKAKELGIRLIQRNLSKVEGDSIRHDPDVIASTIIQLICDELIFEDMQNDSQYMMLNSRLKESKKEIKKRQKKDKKFQRSGKKPFERKPEGIKSKFNSKYKDRIESIKDSDKNATMRRKLVEQKEKEKKIDKKKQK